MLNPLVNCGSIPIYIRKNAWVFETAQLLCLSEDQMHFRAVAWDKQLPRLGMVANPSHKNMAKTWGWFVELR